MSNDLKIAVLISGSGTTLANLLSWQDQGLLRGSIELVISSRVGVKGLDIASAAGIETAVVEARRYTQTAREGEFMRDWVSMSRDIEKRLRPGKFDLICMAGYLSRYVISSEFAGKVLNIHPSLIPMFCGQDMYGQRVHDAVVASGVKVTGCTVHFADNSYDTGPIVLQRCCPVYSDDTPDDVAARVFEEECIAYPTAINLIADGRISILSNKRLYIDGDRLIERFCEHDN